MLSLLTSQPSELSEFSCLRRRETGIVFHILSSVSLRRIRERIADALCICRRFRSRAVMGFELLWLETPDDFAEAFGATEFVFVARRRTGPACGASPSF